MKNKTKTSQYFEWAVLAVVVFFTLRILDKYLFTNYIKPETSQEKWILAIGFIFMTFIVLGVHELGHLLTGLMNGFRFELFVVGPLGIKREGNKIKIYLNKNLGYYGGVAATSPVDGNENNAKKFARILIAGPIASLIFSLICFSIAYLTGKPLGMVFYTGGLVSLAIFFATTIPSKTGIFYTDRKRYQRLTTPGKDQQVELAMLKIIGSFTKDNSYKNIEENDLSLLISDQMPFTRFFGLFNMICLQLEKNGVVEEKYLNDYQTLAKEMKKPMVAAFDKEIERYKQQFQKIKDSKHE
ncbi:MAG: M50 family metallopeptidase [Lewinellaceae bacterium]|nr:M50 family metallopeptidase [Saprospiraceae bacterium]MCB9345710.1 M50 family metallopeptidase [Lewinellaceae bacterium]